MSSSPPSLQSGLQIGDYILNTLSESYPNQQIWLGKQVSVKREVELVCYFGPDQENFLADARIQAKMEDPVLALVYEAIPTEDFIMLSREVLPPRSLETIRQNRMKLLPVELTRIISQVAATLSGLEKRGIAHRAFSAKDIRLGPNNLVRIQNIAQHGSREHDSNFRRGLAEICRSLIKIKQPGATRMATLCDYIQGTPEQPAITWRQTEKLARQVDQQLSVKRVPKAQGATQQKKEVEEAKVWPWFFLSLGAGGLAVWFFFIREKVPVFDPDLVLTIPEKRYALPNGRTSRMKSFRIDATEVTIGEYDEFLTTWRTLSTTKQKRLWAKGKPSSKTSLEPQDWNEYFPIAKAKGNWHGRKMSLNCPVFGVDWWDAKTYANWKKGDLPTEEQWWAASDSKLAIDETFNEWGPVGSDHDQSLIFGLNGNVAEWARLASKNPAFPINPAQPVVLGGTFDRPSKDAFTREWLEDFATRRDNIGFRVTYKVEH